MPRRFESKGHLAARPVPLLLQGVVQHSTRTRAEDKAAVTQKNCAAVGRPCPEVVCSGIASPILELLKSEKLISGEERITQNSLSESADCA